MRAFLVAGLGGLFTFAIAAAIVSCVGDDPEVTAAPAGDAAPSNDTGATSNSNDADVADGDAGATARCSRTSKFGTPVGLNVNSSLDEVRGRLSRNGRTLVFARRDDADASADLHLWMAERASDDGDFTAVRKLTELAVDGTNQLDPSLTPDGLRVVYATTAGADGGKVAEDIVEAIRPNDAFATSFAAPARIASVDTASYDFHPYLTGDGALLFFMSEPSGGDGFTFYQAARAADGTYGPRTDVVGPREQIPKSNSPVATSDGLALYFRHADGKSLYVARRVNAAAAFDQASPISELDDPSAGFQQPSWISDDECVLFFVSDRAGGKGGMDLYVARRAP